MLTVYILIQIIKGTPIWVWLILAYLIIKGIGLRKDGVVSVGKSFIVPSFFIIWGLWKVFTGFNYPLETFLMYLLWLVIGSFSGLKMYGVKQTFYFKNNSFMRAGSLMPMFVILLNFLVKYSLNVLVSINPLLAQELVFNLSYGAISGFTVGLFIGGTINMLKQKSKLEGVSHVG